jgi:integrase
VTDNSLAIIDQPDGTELALPDHLVDAARDFQREALAERTRQTYADAWRLFLDWCNTMGRRSLPASPQSVAGWLTELATGADGKKPRSAATVRLYLASVAYMHKVNGAEFSTGHPEIKAAVAGINRAKAKTDVPRRAKPILADDLRLMLKRFDPLKAGDARDGAMLALGWSGAMRRSEIICLDWERLGEGMGFVRVDERGVEVTLMVSKASQDTATVIAIPAADMPGATEWLQHWAKAANLEPGEPVFMQVSRVGKITRQRITDRTVSDRIKVRVGAYGRAAGKTKEQVEELVRQSSGHSLRRGFCTTASEKGISLEVMASHTRHASLSTLKAYIDTANKWRRSALKDVGF